MAGRRQNNVIPFDWKPFSKKQLKALSWWLPNSPFHDYDMLIADGAVRSGKTVSMVTSFLLWSIASFKGQSFIISGRSIGAINRNVLEVMFPVLKSKGILYYYNRSENYIEIGSNTYYLFGATNEAAYEVMQGLTAAGAYADEIALMPRNFVDQMISRCSIEGAKVFANCNPGSPYHYIKTDFLDKAKEKRIMHLHFTMDDNLSLSEKVKERYKRNFSGVFYRRYILGEWVMAEGLIYGAVFNHDTMILPHHKIPVMKQYWIGIDYGTSNATTFILCGEGVDGNFYICDEYYHSGKESTQKSPAQYSQDFVKWCDSLTDSHGNFIKARLDKTFIDPSAEGFKISLRNEGVKRIQGADNKVKVGIELVSSLMSNKAFFVSAKCEHVIKELSTYSWDPKAQERGEDKPLKVFDHTMDPIRYVVNGTYNTWKRKGLL